jgi:hypothetical protein
MTTVDPENPLPPQSVATAPRGNGFGVAAVILGVVSAAGAFIPFLNYFCVLVAFVGLTLGIVGLVVKNRLRGAAIAGVILSAIGLIVSIIMVIVYTAVFFGVPKAVNDTHKDATKSIILIYSGIGDSTDADVPYDSYTDGKSGSASANNQVLKSP